MPVFLVCQICNQPFPVDPYRQDTALYCSNRCRGQSLRNPEEMALCEQCGGPFIVKRGARFCSTPCRRLSQSAKNMGKSLRDFWGRLDRCTHEWPCPYCCACWCGGVYETGYGEIMVRKERLLTHRVAWELWNGRRIPTGLVVAHYCHTRACCNPMHLHIATQAVNIEDSVRDRRHAFGERQGHSKFTDLTATEALTLYAAGWSIQPLADHFGVTFATAQSLCMGKTWKHLPRPPMFPKLNRPRSVKRQLVLLS